VNFLNIDQLSSEKDVSITKNSHVDIDKRSDDTSTTFANMPATGMSQAYNTLESIAMKPIAKKSDYPTVIVSPVISKELRSEEFIHSNNTPTTTPPVTRSYPTRPDVPDPLGIMEKMLQLEWYDKTFNDMEHPEYMWYVIPRYLQLLLHYDDKIDLLHMRKPSKTVHIEAYREIFSTSSSGKERFYDKLIKLIERDQLDQIVDIIRKDPLVQKHPDPTGKLKKYLVSTEWYSRNLWSYTTMASLEWFMFPPFLENLCAT